MIINMHIYKADDKFLIDNKNGSVIALGSFDAMHIAHQRLIKKAVEIAKINGLISGVDLFLQRPEWVITGKLTSDCILTNKAKAKVIEECGADFVYFENFDKSFMSMSCEDFVESLVNRFNIKYAVAGFHYRFGKESKGDIHTLKTLGKQYGFEVVMLEAVSHDGQIVSSTYIRKLIEGGDVKRASDFLGRAYFLEGIVKSGYKIGRKLGFPTANIEYDKSVIIPHIGVYATFAYVNGRRYNSITNIGYRPTFGGDKEITVEAHIIGFEGDIYGDEIKIEFIDKLRDEKKFGSPDELKAQLNKDIETANALLIK